MVIGSFAEKSQQLFSNDEKTKEGDDGDSRVSPSFEVSHRGGGEDFSVKV